MHSEEPAQVSHVTYGSVYWRVAPQVSVFQEMAFKLFATLSQVHKFFFSVLNLTAAPPPPCLKETFGALVPLSRDLHAWMNPGGSVSSGTIWTERMFREGTGRRRGDDVCWDIAETVSTGKMTAQLVVTGVTVWH